MYLDIRQLTFVLLATALLVTAACQADPPQEGASGTYSPDDIGRNAVLTASYYVEIQRQLRLGKPDEAVKLIDSEYSRLLTQLRQSNAAIEKDYRFRRLRDKVVTELQTRWLKEPPMYLDNLSVDYLERTCAAIAGCPRGRVHPLKEPLVPSESEAR